MKTVSHSCLKHENYVKTYIGLRYFYMRDVALVETPSDKEF